MAQSKKRISAKNMNLLCRTCLLELKPKQKHNIHRMDILIRHWLKDSSATTAGNDIESIKDVYPEFVCTLCYDKLEDFLEFRRMCSRSHNMIKAILRAENMTVSEDNLNFLEESVVVEEEPVESAILNEIYEDGDLLGFDCIPVQKEATIASSSVETFDTVQRQREHLNNKCGNKPNLKRKRQDDDEPEEEVSGIATFVDHQYCLKPKILTETEEMSGEDVNELQSDYDLVEFDFVTIPVTNIKAQRAPNFDIEETIISPKKKYKYSEEYLEDIMVNDGASNYRIEIKNEAQEENHNDEIGNIETADDEIADDETVIDETDINETDINETVIDETAIAESTRNNCEQTKIAIRTSSPRARRRKYACDECSKSFLNQCTLDNHKRIHQNPKSDCSLNKPCNLEKKYPRVETENRIVCAYEDCGKEFGRTSSYLSHCRFRHGLETHEVYKILQQSRKAFENDGDEAEKQSPVANTKKANTTKISRRNPESLNETATENEEEGEEEDSFSQHSEQYLEDIEIITDKKHSTPKEDEDEDDDDDDSDYDVDNDEDFAISTDSSVLQVKKVKKTSKRKINYKRSSTRKQSKVHYKFRCDMCYKRCLNERTLEAHKRTHKGLSAYQCPKCDKGFPALMKLTTHLNEFHTEVIFKCKYEGCDRVYHRSNSYRQHLRAKHEPRPKKSKDFVVKTKPKPRLQCEECGKSCINRSQLNEHVQSIHKPKEEYEFNCPDCDKVFPTRSRLSSHQQVHSEIRKYQCSYCDLAVKSRYALKIHTNTHTLERQYPCTKCDMVFSAKLYLSRHVRVRHEGYKPYRCSHCDRTFGIYHAWKCHEMTHEGERPHECPECGYRFLQRSSMRRHLQNIHNISLPKLRPNGKHGELKSNIVESI